MAYRLGPQVQQQFLPTPDPLMMLFRGLGFDGSNTSTRKLKSDGNSGFDDLKMLPGAASDYLIRQTQAENKLDAKKKSIIKESSTYAGELDDYYKNTDAIQRLKDANIEYQSTILGLSSIKAQKEQEAVRYKEQQKNLQDNNITGNARLYDSEGNWGIQSSVTDITPDGKVYTAQQLDLYNQYRNLDTQFVEVPVPDYKYFDDRRNQIFSGLGSDELKTTFTKINQSMAFDDDGNYLPVKTIVENGGGKLLPKNIQQVSAALNRWQQEIASDPKLRQVYNIKKGVFESIPENKDRSFIENLLTNERVMQTSYQTVGSVTIDKSYDPIKVQTTGLLHQLETGKIEPNSMDNTQVLKNKDGEYYLGKLGNRTWNLTPVAFDVQNNSLQERWQSNNPTKLADFTDKQYVYINGVPVSMNIMRNMNAVVTSLEGRVVEYNQPEWTGNTPVAPSSYEEVFWNSPSIKGDYTLSLPEYAQGTQSTSGTRDVVNTDKEKTLRARILVPGGGGNLFTHSTAYNMMKDIPQFDYLFNETEFSPKKQAVYSELSNKEIEKGGVRGEDDYWEIIVDIPVSNLALYGDQMNNYLKYITAKAERDRALQELNESSAFSTGLMR